MRKNKFLEWANCHLLPFADLTIWEIEKDVELTNRELAAFLGDIGEENVRKTTRKNAEIVFSDGIEGGIFMRLLAAYAAEEC
jgi:hypothetical protein